MNKFPNSQPFSPTRKLLSVVKKGKLIWRRDKSRIKVANQISGFVGAMGKMGLSLERKHLTLFLLNDPPHFKMHWPPYACNGCSPKAVFMALPSPPPGKQRSESPKAPSPNKGPRSAFRPVAIRGKFLCLAQGRPTSPLTHAPRLLPKETKALPSVFQVKVCLQLSVCDWLFLSSYS